MGKPIESPVLTPFSSQNDPDAQGSPPPGCTAWEPTYLVETHYGVRHWPSRSNNIGVAIVFPTPKTALPILGLSPTSASAGNGVENRLRIRHTISYLQQHPTPWLVI